MTTNVTDMNNEKVEENNNEKKIKALENTINGYTNLIFNNNNNNNSSTIDDLENIIESSLVRADELKALLNTVKNDSETATDVLLPQLAEHCKQLLRVFQVIDALAQVVSSLKKSAMELDTKLQKVQQVYELRHPSSLGRLFGKLLRSSSMDANVKEELPPMPKWEGSDFIEDTSIILKEARLKWLDSAATTTTIDNNNNDVGDDDKKSENINDGKKNSRSDSIDV